MEKENEDCEHSKEEHWLSDDDGYYYCLECGAGGFTLNPKEMKNAPEKIK